MEKKRSQWSSNLGFILAAAGSAIGLGNIWKFPYMAGSNGGFAFIIIYLIIVLLIGIPVMMAEISVGRKMRMNAYDSFRTISSKWAFVGGLGVLCGFVILSFYSVIGGWSISYFLKFIVAIFNPASMPADTAGMFTELIGDVFQPILFHILFMAACIVIVLKGIAGGIEKASKFMMPTLFILLIITIIRSLTLGGNAMQGVSFLFKPDFSAITPKVLLAALGQAFFSLSLGMGCLVTYGSYLKREDNITKSAAIICGLDTLIAILAGLAIFPAVFAFKVEPGAGPGLVFITLPALFQQMPFGNFFGALFFLLIIFAALTSAISLLEVVNAFAIEKFNMPRNVSTIIVGIVIFLVGIPSALSQGGPLSGNLLPDWVPVLGGVPFLDFMSNLSDMLLPIGGFFICLVVAYVWKFDNAAKEISVDGSGRFPMRKAFEILVAVLIPIAILIVFLNIFGVFNVFFQ